MDKPYAKVIADSTYDCGTRLTTFEVRFHRFVLSEFNTHRVFSRNSASSRAIPITKQISRIEEGLAVPLSWPCEQPGMQGGIELDEGDSRSAGEEWARAAESAVKSAWRLRELGVHKSVTNRLLEPYMWHTVVVTSTAWDNFFAQRCSDLAQPEIRVMAEQMAEALGSSVPNTLVAEDWHLPYVTSLEREELSRETSGLSQLVRISAARCARTSYLTQDGVRDQQKDLDLYDRLVTARPAHWSPLEHVATPWTENRSAGRLMFESLDGSQQKASTDHLPLVGNLLGWRSLRTEVETSLDERTFA